LKIEKRFVCADTETTGFSPEMDRVVEVALVEVVGSSIGRKYQQYFSIETEMPEAARKVHGLTRQLLASYKPFNLLCFGDITDFIGDATVVAHNAKFDISFLDAEAKRLGVPGFSPPFVDTVKEFRKAFPKKRATLDGMCDALGVDRALRSSHGALVDTELLAKCWIELRKSQGVITFAPSADVGAAVDPGIVIEPTPEELAEHDRVMAAHKITKPQGDKLWFA
jgi:DNA polymerase-3 subunit epsilon